MSREMKDSGIEWVKLIPADWVTTRFKYTHSNSNVGDSVDKTLYSENEEGYVFYMAGSNPIMTAYTDFPNWKYTKESDLLMARNGTPYVYLPVSGAVYSDHVIRTTIGKDYDRRFIRYCLQQGISNEVVETVSIPTWSISLWNEIAIPLPSIYEQHRIADFLDSKCSQIDEISKKIQEEIETLEEYKKSVITEAVTKGLDPNVEMKDSGIEWIGRIPANWNAIPFQYVLKERSEKNNPIKTDERLALSIGKGVTTYAEKTTNLDRFKDDVSGYKLAHQGDLVMNSMNMIVGATGISNYYGCVSPAYYTFYDEEDDHIIAKWCEQLFLTPILMGEFHKLGKGIMFIERGEGRVNTCRLKVSRYDLGKIMLPIPSLAEMREIVQFLNEKSTKIDHSIETKRQQLSTLEEYKKSLIYEYVTGKKEVPDANT